MDSQCKRLTKTKPYCLQGSCRAQQCTKDAHCLNKFKTRLTTPFCVRVNGTMHCRECKNDKCCSSNSSRKACYNQTGTCVQCTQDVHCAKLARNGVFGANTNPADMQCAYHLCVRRADPGTNITDCAKDSDCVASGTGTLCQNGSCVECLTEQDCSKGVFAGANAQCLKGRCTECSGNSDCEQYKAPLGPPPLCSAGKCVECMGSSSVSSSRSGTCPVGLFGVQGSCQQGKCVECIVDGDCPRAANQPGGGVCNQSTSKCIQCRADIDCGKGLCQNGVCLECSTDADCSPGLFGVTGTCQSGRCVECSSDDQCAGFQYKHGPKPICSAAGKCVECAAERPCAVGLFGANATCQAGRCVECNAANAYSCPKDVSRPGGVCDESIFKCIQCKIDGDCGNNGTCVDGVCKECTSDQDCRPGVFGVAGTCQAGLCIECSSNADCAQFKYEFGPTPVCSSGKCVECAGDSPCPLGLWGAKGTCNAGKCVECGADSDCPKRMLRPGGICQTNASAAAFGKCIECRAADDCRFALHPGKALMCWAAEGCCEVCVSDSDCIGFAGVSGMGPYCVKNECATKGRPCQLDADCTYTGSCLGYSPCPTPTCLNGYCDSHISGLTDGLGMDVGR